MPAGRPVEYTDKIVKEIAAKICTGVASGNSLASICKEKGMPSISKFYVWLRDYEKIKEDYARAKEDRADVIFDKIEEIEQQVLAGEINPHQGRVVIDSMKWRLGKMNHKYSDNRHEFKVSSDISEDLETRLNRAKEKGRIAHMGEQAKLEMLKKSIEA